MRVKLNFEQVEQRTCLPINYNYYLTALIYRILSRSSRNYSEFLHDGGYNHNDSKNLKLFTYSQLRFSEMKVRGNRIISTSDQLQLFISSPIDLFVKHLANGLLAEGEVKIADSRFRTRTVEIMELPEFLDGESVKFLCLSPIVSSTMIEKNGKLKTYYYRHDDPELPNTIEKNLKKKYRLVYGEEPTKDNSQFKLAFDKHYLKKRGGKITKLIDFKGTKIKGIFAPFKLNAPPELMEIGYEAGFGGKGSMGFGMVEVV